MSHVNEKLTDAEVRTLLSFVRAFVVPAIEDGRINDYEDGVLIAGFKLYGIHEIFFRDPKSAQDILKEGVATKITSQKARQDILEAKLRVDADDQILLSENDRIGVIEWLETRSQKILGVSLEDLVNQQRQHSQRAYTSWKENHLRKVVPVSENADEGAGVSAQGAASEQQPSDTGTGGATEEFEDGPSASVDISEVAGNNKPGNGVGVTLTDPGQPPSATAATPAVTLKRASETPKANTSSGAESEANIQGAGKNGEPGAVLEDPANPEAHPDSVSDNGEATTPMTVATRDLDAATPSKAGDPTEANAAGLKTANPTVASTLCLTSDGSNKTLRLKIATPIGKDMVAGFGEGHEYYSSTQFTVEREADDQWSVLPNSDATNETLLNGETITERKRLREGDKLAVGRVAKGITKLPLTVHFEN